MTAHTSGCWPVDSLRTHLSNEEFLHALCGAKRPSSGSGFNTREHILEQLVRSVVANEIGGSELIQPQILGATLAIAGNSFPLRTRPDVVFRLNGGFHIGEVKSGRVDDNRMQRVVGKAVGEHLAAIGHAGQPPWEVEQDLIKILKFGSLSASVYSTALLLVDAYQGSGHSWARIFASKEKFVATMRTAFIRDRADRLLSATEILPITTPSIRANFIVCVIEAPSNQRAA